MPDGSIRRRTFLASAALAAAAASRPALSARGTNERLSIGVIGTGGRGTDHINLIAAQAKKANAAVTAVCDVWKPNREAAAKKVKAAFGADARQFSRFQELLALDDLDAVTIATPDFSHGPILVAALKAGKDVYIEKPMTIQLAHANAALDAAREGQRVVQCGTQYRSMGPIIGVAREVATGVLGKISRISAAASFNHPRWDRDFANCKEQDVDWDAFLMDLPKRPFAPSLLREWQLWHETSNGLAGLWMTHYVDATQLMCGLPYPRSAVAHGGNYVWKDRRETEDTFHALIEYPDGPLFDWAMNLGTGADWRYMIAGLQGTITPKNGQLSSPEWTISNTGGSSDSKIKPGAIKPEPGGDHMLNFLECIRTRSKPRADIAFGHQHAVSSIMAAEALYSGRRQVYDAQKREIKPG